MASKRRTRRHVPPSRLRYEQNNPTISFRLPLNLKDELEQILAVSEQSFADFVKEALKVKERTVGAAYDHGHRAAKETYLVTYRCSVCGKTVEVQSSEAKAAAREFLEEIDGLAHEDCRNR